MSGSQISDEQLKKLGELEARMERLPIRPYPRKWLVILGIGYFFAFYDILALSYNFISPMVVSLHMTTILLADSASATLFGYIVGEYTISTISDYKGRRIGLIVNALVVAIGTIICAISVNATELIIFRFVTGMGIGAEISIINTYMSEVTPAHMRGKMTQWAYFSGALGFALTPFIAAVVIPINANGWRYLFAIPAVMAIAIVFFRFSMPETPRWLVLKGRINDAENVVANMEAYVKSKINTLPPPKEFHPEASYVSQYPTKDIMNKKYASRLLVIVIFWFLDYTLAYGFLGFAPTIFDTAGFTFLSTALYLGIGSTGYIVGAVAMTWIADMWERKYLVICAVIPAIFAAFIFALALIDHSVGLIAVGSFLGAFATAFAVPAYTYTAEMFPTRARATGFALSDGIGHLGGAIVPFIFSAIVILEVSKIVPTGSKFFILLGILEIVAAIVLFAGPKTTNKSLEVISP